MAVSLCAASASCTAIIDLQEPPAGASDGGQVGDGQAPDASTNDGSTGDATTADTSADTSMNDAITADTSMADGTPPDATTADTASDVAAGETGDDAAGDSDAPADSPFDVPDGEAIVAGSISGLPPGASVTLQDDGGNNLTIQAGADAGASIPFAFPTPVADGSPYFVTVSAQPANALCTVNGGSGTAPGGPIEVQCGAVTAVASGYTSSCAIVAGGTVDCWGDNSHGQLGNGTFTNVLPVVPFRVPLLFAVTDIAVGQDHACALQGGAVYCWGYNAAGQLGTGNTTSYSTPQPVNLSGPAVAITASYQHSCALLMSGGVECWGDNTQGDLGNGATASSPSPVVVSAVGGGGALTNVVAIDAGVAHTCALLKTGTVVCWGDGNNGQLGNGSTSSSVPVQSTITNAVSISAGAYHTCAVVGAAEAGAGGSVSCWGEDTSGQTGNTTLTGVAPPALVSLSLAATDVTCGGAFTCARLVDGTVECWGLNIYGQLGNSTLTNAQPKPAVITGLAGVTSVAAGDQHACAALSSGGVECWGSNAWGQLANGAPGFPTPAGITGLTGVQSLGLGSPAFHACAVVAEAGVACWGNNSSGQLANATEIPSSAPVPVPGVAGALAVAVGGDHTCALVDGGTVTCWGYDTSGQLGNGVTTATVPTPTPVPGLTGVVAIGAGQNYTCALLSGGTVDCWGINAQGELGNGTTTNADTPTAVVGLTGAKALATGSFHACVVLGDGGVDCWGQNNNGQLGVTLDGGTQSTTFVPVPDVNGAVAIAAGANHTCAIVGDGGVDCWGANAQGQLGNGTTSNSANPTASAVLGLTGGALQIAAGAAHTCARMTGGGIACWGGNASGALTTAAGVPYGLDTTTAVTIPGVTGVVSVFTGQNSTCALLAGGASECWGWNAYGQLGTGQPSQSSTPVPVE